MFLVQFYTSTCTTCHALKPTFTELSEKHKTKGVFAKVNAEINPGIGMRYGVLGVPAFKFFKNGKLIGDLKGSISKRNLQEAVVKLLG